MDSTLHRPPSRSHTKRLTGAEIPRPPGEGVDFFEALSRLFRLAEALGFEPFEFFSHCSFHDRSEVYAKHERGEPLDFVTELGA